MTAAQGKSLSARKATRKTAASKPESYVCGDCGGPIICESCGLYQDPPAEDQRMHSEAQERFADLEAERKKLRGWLTATEKALTESQVRAEKAESEVERLKAWVCPFDMTLCEIHIHERGGREADTSGEASPTRVASPPHNHTDRDYDVAMCPGCFARGSRWPWVGPFPAAAEPAAPRKEAK